MNVHENARLTPRGREALVRRVLAGESVESAAEAFSVSVRTVVKWVKRFQDQGLAGLQDRSSRPRRLRAVTPDAIATRVEELRRQRQTMLSIAAEVGVSLATVGRLLKARGLSRLASLEPKPRIVRYERERPGELLHIDTKKLGKIVRPSHRVTGDRRDRVEGAGWEYLHLAIDDHTRLAYTEILRDERKASATAFLLRALDWFGTHGVTVEGVMTDNGTAYRSRLWRRACQSLEVRHIRTRPYTPKTNGKVERLVQTSLREWAYVRSYENSAERHAALAPWNHHYNYRRPHFGIGRQTPISRLVRNNLLSHNN